MDENHTRQIISLYGSASMFYGLTCTIDFKRHKDAVGYFNQHYVKDGPISREIGRKLGRLKQYREEGDYEDFYVVAEEEAEEQIEAAAEIIGEIKNYLTAKESEDEV